MSFDKQKLLISQLENMKMELEEELNASEENREILKADLEDANSKIVDLEEDLFESKTIQLELLENLKVAEDKYELVVIEHERVYAELERKFADRLRF